MSSEKNCPPIVSASPSASQTLGLRQGQQSDQSLAVGLAARILEDLAHLARSTGFGDGETIDRQHRRADELAERPSCHKRSRAAIRSSRSWISASSRGSCMRAPRWVAIRAPQDSSFVAELGIELALGDPCARRDLERAGTGIAAPRSAPHRPRPGWSVGAARALRAAKGSASAPWRSARPFFHSFPLTWYQKVP